MKRILLAICGMAATSVLHAQIMPDSTVQICAYWTPGDKYAYNATEEKLKIDEKGDTMLVYRRSERRTFEVLAQTQERYQLRLSYSDYKSTDEQEQLIHDVIAAVTGAEIVEFTTSETGVLLGLTNLDALVEQAKAAVDPIVEATWKNMAPEERRLLSKKDFRKYLAHTLGDPSVLINAANDDLGRMCSFSTAHDSIRRGSMKWTKCLPRYSEGRTPCRERRHSGSVVALPTHTAQCAVPTLKWRMRRRLSPRQ